MTKTSLFKCLIAVGVIARRVFTFCGTTDPITWTLNSGVLTISGRDTMPNYKYEWELVNIPWYTHRGYITSVIIEDGITSIGRAAFVECSALAYVTIPNSVTSIGEWAFWGCSALTSVDIPNSVTSIGDDAFEHCSNLTSVTLPNSVTSIGEGAFRECSKLTSVTCLNPIPPTLGDDVFIGASGSITFHVPAGSVAAYEAAGWGSYGTVVAIVP
ncbi:hypothetical protein FACS1894199_13080 [Bacteroidia bacterium]|nr:hypothetical protein FACS1894199_13080 [Bacteroidia bacterium]